MESLRHTAKDNFGLLIDFLFPRAYKLEATAKVFTPLISQKISL